MNTDLRNKFSDPDQAVYFIGTTPPKASTDDEKMLEIADRLLARLSGLNCDGLIVYDIQDESARIDKPRPFPFMGTRDPREYSQLLAEQSGRSTITYKSVSQRDVADFRQWLSEAWQAYGLRNLVLVGSPAQTADIKLSLTDAYEELAAKRQPVEGSETQDFNLGGVTIAERHAKKGTEHQRLMDKSVQGCNFFVSQAVYNAQATIDLLHSYGQLCQQQGQAPKRIILTFTPCGSAKTLDFMRWLGISVPDDIAESIITAESPLARSIELCHDNLSRILDACLPLGIPIGLNIESLTNRKEEIEASIRLFELLQGTLDTALAARSS